MIKIENVSVYDQSAAFRGMRNPLNSWANGDDGGERDMELAMKLVQSGTSHRKFLRMMMVSLDITAPRYWWTEFDTYKVGTVANSCSTMHKLMDKGLTIDDFSTDGMSEPSIKMLRTISESVNLYIYSYKAAKSEEKRREFFLTAVKLLPQSYNQRRTVMLSYETLRAMYEQRKGHKLPEWQTFREWMETLPHSELITTK